MIDKLKNRITYLLILLLFCISVKQAYSQLTITPGHGFVLKEGTTLTIKGDLKVQSDSLGTGIIADQTNLGSILIEGNIQIDQYVDKNSWHNISSPINNASTAAFSGTEYIYYYDESIIANDWDFGWILYPSGSLDIMKGYDVYYEDQRDTVSFTTSFPSGLNTGSKSISLTYTNGTNGEIAERTGWNLIGNPYPSPLDWLSTAWDKNDINDAFYIWNANNNNYAGYIGGAVPQGVNGGTQYIPAMQGFWVKSTNDGSISVNNSARVLFTPGTPSYFKQGESCDIIKLMASNNHSFDETIIRFHPDASQGYDNLFDAPKLFSNSENVPQLFTIAENSNLSINTLSCNEDISYINLFFKCINSGIFSLEGKEIILDNQIHKTVYIQDLKEDLIFNIQEIDTYDFSYNANDEPLRFRIIFDLNDIPGEIKEADLNIYSFRNKIFIKKLNDDYLYGTLNVYNIMGQEVFSSSLQNVSVNEYSLNIDKGTYIIKVMANYNIHSKKVFISN